MIRVLIVEDDFRVAQVHVAYAERVPGFSVVGIAHTSAQARQAIQAHEPHLILLDCYLPDEPGLDLLRDITVDTIVLTAASDAASVRTAFARGALNYLIKPFGAVQLADRLSAYARYRKHIAGDRALSQDEVDRAFRLLHEGDRLITPKGQSPLTVRLVAESLRLAQGARSAAEIATELGISRATAQRYLATLVQSGEAQVALRYGTTGRPEHRYSVARKR